ncbi:hypothetical protein [Ensifer canadensis]
MTEVPQISDQLTFKLLFGLLEGSATGSFAVTCLFTLGMLFMIGKGIRALIDIYRTRSNVAKNKRK